MGSRRAWFEVVQRHHENRFIILTAESEIRRLDVEGVHNLVASVKLQRQELAEAINALNQERHLIDTERQQLQQANLADGDRLCRDLDIHMLDLRERASSQVTKAYEYLCTELSEQLVTDMAHLELEIARILSELEEERRVRATEIEALERQIRGSRTEINDRIMRLRAAIDTADDRLYGVEKGITNTEKRVAGVEQSVHGLAGIFWDGSFAPQGEKGSGTQESLSSASKQRPVTWGYRFEEHCQHVDRGKYFPHCKFCIESVDED